jgi:hypothetical protein
MRCDLGIVVRRGGSRIDVWTMVCTPYAVARYGEDRFVDVGGSGSLSRRNWYGHRTGGLVGRVRGRWDATFRGM